MRDIDASVYKRVKQTANIIESLLDEQDFQPIDTPILEETELFVRKSGGELAGRLYTFTDPGGHSVSLRPEFTSSVIRHFIQEQDNITLPAKWQYSGPVFRYQPGNSGTYRQFTQVGAEVVGASGTGVDAELISVAWTGLQRAGLKDFQLRIGHLGVLRDILGKFGLSEPAKLFIIGNIAALKSSETTVDSLKERAQEVGLLRNGTDLSLNANIGDMSKEAAQDFVQSVLRESMPAPVGRRSSDQIVSRLLRKMRQSDDPEAFNSALSLASKLAMLQGQPSKVLEQAKAVVVEAGLDASSLDELESLTQNIAQRRVTQENTILDMGLARGISYYTGVIFEFMLDSDRGISLGGGGRYDGLVKALGSDQDVPAMGFAYYLDQITDVLVSYSEASDTVTVNS